MLPPVVDIGYNMTCFNVVLRNEFQSRGHSYSRHSSSYLLALLRIFVVTVSNFDINTLYVLKVYAGGKILHF